VLVGTCWYLLVLVGACWCLLVLVGACWYLLALVAALVAALVMHATLLFTFCFQSCLDHFQVGRQSKDATSEIENQRTEFESGGNGAVHGGQKRGQSIEKSRKRFSTNGKGKWFYHE
jgi:hypothetical protein